MENTKLPDTLQEARHELLDFTPLEIAKASTLEIEDVRTRDEHTCSTPSSSSTKHSSQILVCTASQQQIKILLELRTDLEQIRQKNLQNVNSMLAARTADKTDAKLVYFQTLMFKNLQAHDLKKELDKKTSNFFVLLRLKDQAPEAKLPEGLPDWLQAYDMIGFSITLKTQVDGLTKISWIGAENLKVKFTEPDQTITGGSILLQYVLFYLRKKKVLYVCLNSVPSACITRFYDKHGFTCVLQKPALVEFFNDYEENITHVISLVGKLSKEIKGDITQLDEAYHSEGTDNWGIGIENHPRICMEEKTFRKDIIPGDRKRLRTNEDIPYLQAGPLLRSGLCGKDACNIYKHLYDKYEHSVFGDASYKHDEADATYIRNDSVSVGKNYVYNLQKPTSEVRSKFKDILDKMVKNNLQKKTNVGDEDDVDIIDKRSNSMYIPFLSDLPSKVITNVFVYRATLYELYVMVRKKSSQEVDNHIEGLKEVIRAFCPLVCIQEQYMKDIEIGKQTRAFILLEKEERTSGYKLKYALEWLNSYEPVGILIASVVHFDAGRPISAVVIDLLCTPAHTKVRINKQLVPADEFLVEYSKTYWKHESKYDYIVARASPVAAYAKTYEKCNFDCIKHASVWKSLANTRLHDFTHVFRLKPKQKDKLVRDTSKVCIDKTKRKDIINKDNLLPENPERGWGDEIRSENMNAYKRYMEDYLSIKEDSPVLRANPQAKAATRPTSESSRQTLSREAPGPKAKTPLFKASPKATTSSKAETVRNRPAAAMEIPPKAKTSQSTPSSSSQGAVEDRDPAITLEKFAARRVEERGSIQPYTLAINYLKNELERNFNEDSLAIEIFNQLKGYLTDPQHLEENQRPSKDVLQRIILFLHKIYWFGRFDYVSSDSIRTKALQAHIYNMPPQGWKLGLDIIYCICTENGVIDTWYKNGTLEPMPLDPLLEHDSKYKSKPQYKNINHYTFFLKFLDKFRNQTSFEPFLDEGKRVKVRREFATLAEAYRKLNLKNEITWK